MQLTALPEGLPLQPAGLLQPSPEGALAAGTALGHLSQLGSQLALEKAQRKAEMASTDYKLAALEHLQTNLPLQAAADAAAARAAAAGSAVTEVQSGTALAAAQATRQNAIDAAAVQSANALATAKAASSFSGRSPTQQAQALAAAKALGDMGLPPDEGPGGISAPSVFLRDDAGKVIPPGFIDSFTREETDPETLDVHNVQVMLNKFTGDVIKKTDLGVIKSGSVQRPITQAIPEATAIVQTMAMADKLDQTLEQYTAGGNGGVLQAIATNQANRGPTGAWSVLSKAVGAKFQSPATVKLAGEIQNLKNTLANAMFGSALTKEESQNLQGMLPTPEDIADPARARAKLATTRQFLEEKLKPYKDRGVLTAAKLQEPQRAAQAAAAPAASQWAEGSEAMVNGIRMRRTVVNGVGGWAPIGQ